MNSDDVLGFAKKAIPWIGAAATGNVPALVTMAAAAVSSALGVDVAATSGAVATAIAGATPEQLMALKQADNDFALKMKELNFKEASELEAGAYADMQGARQRDVDLVKTTGHTNKRASVMLALTFLALIMLVSVMLFKNIDANSALGGVVLLLIGKFSGDWDTAFQFEFGTTRSSKGKDDTIATAVQTAASKP